MTAKVGALRVIPEESTEQELGMAGPPNQHAAFIIHAHLPYCFDLNEILALPSGLRYRNRFDAQWIEPALIADLDTLVGQEVLIILRDPLSNTLIPVRWGEIVTVVPVGKIVYFEYILSDIVRYSNATNVRAQEIIDHTRAFSAQHSWLPGPQGVGLTAPSVFKTNVGFNLSRDDADDLRAWGNCIEALATASIYENIEFLKIVGLYGPSGSSARVRSEAYEVERKTVYTLRVFQHVPRPTVPMPSHSIEVNTFQSHIVALRASQRAVGKYDMLTFVLKVLELNARERTAMEIPHIPNVATSNDALTSLYLPVTVARQPRANLIAAGVILLASLVLMFVPTLVGLSPELVRNVATVIFVLTLTGPARTLATIWPSWPWSGR